MDVAYVLFSPNGRIGPNRFARGFILLTGAMVILEALSAAVAPAFASLSFLLIFPYLCVFGKRLHDAGQSAALWLAFVAAYILLSAMITAVLLPMLAPEAMAIQLEVSERIQEGGLSAGMELMEARAPELRRLTGLPNLIAFVFSSAIVGYIAYRIKGTPGPNQHGPISDDGPFN
jgi:uncharacterized membrane protein YhaH (DUF805 family)